MSRGGGRGGGRGGRGGGRGGRPALPWDDTDEPDARPSDLFPPCVVPTPRDLSATEYNGIQYMLLLRHQIHSSALYTSKRTYLLDPTAPRKTYGRDQMNALYDIKNKASVDPFTAVPTYSQRFARAERALPDWSARPVCREMYPPELLDTVDSVDATGVRKKRRLELSKVNALPNAEEAFGMPALDDYDEDGGAPVDGKNLLEKLDALRDEDGEEGADLEDEEALEEEADDAYDDDDIGGDDYNAEQYFDNGDDYDDGDGDDGGDGTY